MEREEGGKKKSGKVMEEERKERMEIGWEIKTKKERKGNEGWKKKKRDGRR